MLTFGGVELGFPDAEGVLTKWLREHQPLEDTVAVSDRRLSEVSPRRGLQSWYGIRKGIGQTVANYPGAPAPRLNTLYWPTGATRWARGYFLASGDAKNAIVKLAHSVGGNSPLSLAMGDDGSYLQTSMFLLPPRPVSRIATAIGQSDESLWILPLVDHRYWWQFSSVDDLEVTTSTTWTSLFGTLGSKLGVTVTLPTGVAAAYLQPDPIEFTRRYENAAAMLDAAALSVGKRIVRRVDGTVRAESAADATTALSENLEGDWQLVCGGEFTNEAGDVPASVVTTFRKWRHYALLQKGQAYTESKAADSSTVVSGSEVIIHSTAFANCNSSDSSPSNTSDLAALATAIGNDYYAWKAKRHDYTFSGIKAWHPSGFDDAVMWEFGRQVDGAYRAQTRIQTLPADLGFDLQLSQFSTMGLLESPVLGKIDSAISKNARGTVSVWTGRSGSKSDSGINIDACASSAALTSTTKFVSANWVDDDWEVACWEI